MNESNPLSLVSVAVLCGVLLSLAFVNPYSGQVTLSELVLQLSGSRGDLPLGTSLPELLSFSIKMVPYFLFELYIGVYLYRHFLYGERLCVLKNRSPHTLVCQRMSEDLRCRHPLSSCSAGNGYYRYALSL